MKTILLQKNGSYINFISGMGTGVLTLKHASILPDEVEVGCLYTISDVPATDIVMTVGEPEHAEGKVWIKIQQYGEPQTISNSGNAMLKLHSAWQSNGVSWIAIDAYYALIQEWVQFSHTYVEFGIQWDYSQSTPLLTRLGDAVGKNAIASVGLVAGSSDFDTLPIFGDIKTVNLADNGIINAYEGEANFKRDGSNGQVMVQIPKFWYKVVNDQTNSLLQIWIANQAIDGYSVCPMFTMNQTEQEYAYIGAYKMGANYTSKTGVAPLVNLTRSAFRSGIKNARGSSWSLVDVASRIWVGLLQVIEYATLDLQSAIGPGVSNVSAAVNTGGSDGIIGGTGRPEGTGAAVNVRWRGIEDWWGNVWEWIDGLNWNGGSYYINLDQGTFADDTATNYTKLSYTGSTSFSSSYGTKLGYDESNSGILLPNTASGGSSGTYLCDGLWSSTGWKVADSGGSWDSAGLCGPFAWSWYAASSDAYSAVGGRLRHVPTTN